MVALPQAGVAFGCQLVSDLPLPLGQGTGAQEVCVKLGWPAAGQDGDLQFPAEAPDLPSCVISPASSQVWIECNAAERGAAWSAVLGFSLPHLLAQRGTPILHASCVSRGRSAVAFLGTPGTGKSTAAAALIRRGWRLVCDDALALDPLHGRIKVPRSFPALRLWTPTAHWFSAGQPAAPVHPTIDKWWVLLDGSDWQSELELTTVCLLSRGHQEPRPVGGAEALVELLRSLYHGPDASRGAFARSLDVAHQIAGSIPVLRVFLPDQLQPELLGEQLEGLLG